MCAAKLYLYQFVLQSYLYNRTYDIIENQQDYYITQTFYANGTRGVEAKKVCLTFDSFDANVRGVAIEACHGKSTCYLHLLLFASYL